MTSHLDTRWRALARGSSIMTLGVALAVSTPAFAQATADQSVESSADESVATTADEAPADNANEIVVTGSRISTAGFDAPTPTTVIGVAELQQAGRTDIQASLSDLPQFRQTSSATSTNTVTNSGISPGDLRGLGAARTLVLINNRRHVSSNDLQTIPYSLVKRIDVVTGGASAAYGSGAVAGVVNIILDDNKKGFELGAQTGISERGDAQKYLFEASMGTSFANDRGHFMIGGDYLKDEGIIPGNARPLIGSTGFFPDANGKLVPTADVVDSNRNEGGVINSGVLAGQTFNSDGSLRPFQYGIRRPGAPTTMIGGEGFNTDQVRSLSAPIQRANVFARASYDLTDSLKIWVEGGFNRVWDDRVFFADLAAAANFNTFSRDNPFLNPTARAALVAAGQTTFTMGRALTDVSLATYKYSREAIQGSIGLDGSFGGGKWRYNAFFSHGEQTQDQLLRDITLRTEFAQAIDAVAGPGGTIVCRVALTNPGTACRPLNLFGSGRADPAAIDYVTDDWHAITKTWLDHAGASITGEPFTLWDLPVSVAAGVEYREEAFQNDFDANSLAGKFNTINGVAIPKTGNNVKEGFAEVNIPLLANLPMVQTLNFNGAVRVSDYSTGGAIWSWKLGGVWDVIDGLKFRATRSRDIRAASLSELFQQRSTLFTTVVDLGRPTSPSTNIILYTGGNPDLAPEIADTLTVGGVISPRFLPGFNFSVDYYDIKIKNVITTLSGQQIVNGCYLQSNQNACAQIVRIGSGPDAPIGQINASFINVANFRNKGLDFEASYRTRLETIGLPGQLSVRALANYVDSLVVNNGVLAIDGAGYVGSQAGYLVPKWRGLLTVNYESEGMGADVRTRYVGGGGYAPKTVLANQDARVDSRVYVDLGLRAYFSIADGKRITIFGNVQNLFDRQPPLAAISSPYYDLIGRYFTAGVRASF